MILPSAVRFVSCTECSDILRGIEGLSLVDRDPRGKGDGREDAEVLAGALRRPRGSFRFEWDIRRTEPATMFHVSFTCQIYSFAGWFWKICIYLPHPIYCHILKNAPGTSSVFLSLRTPMLHFSGFPFPPYAFADACELSGSPEACDRPKSLFHRGAFTGAAVLSSALEAAAGACRGVGSLMGGWVGMASKCRFWEGGGSTWSGYRTALDGC